MVGGLGISVLGPPFFITLQSWGISARTIIMAHQKNILRLFFAFLATLLLSNCGTVTVSKAPFGKTSDGKPVDIYTLTNPGGMKAKITNYGGIVT